MNERNEREAETMTTQEVCAALAISRKTLYAWERKGYLRRAPSDAPWKRRQPVRWMRADVEHLKQPPPSTTTQP